MCREERKVGQRELCQKHLGRVMGLNGVGLGLQPSPLHCLSQSPSLSGNEGEALLWPQSKPPPSSSATRPWKRECRTQDLLSQSTDGRRAGYSDKRSNQRITSQTHRDSPVTDSPEQNEPLLGASPAGPPEPPPGLLVSRRRPDTDARGCERPGRSRGSLPRHSRGDHTPATHLPSAPRAQHPEILMPG